MALQCRVGATVNRLLSVLELVLCCAAVWGCKTDNDGGNTDVEYTDMTDDMPAPGNPDANCPVPDEAMEEDTTAPDRVIGNGTPESCTGQAVVDAVALGGVITFDCGPDPLTIALEETAKIFNDTGPEIVIDGGGKVALSGGGQ